MKVRLIDADAMYDEFVRKSSIYDTTDLPEMLGDMPTIDAIPVEWLMDMANRGDFVYSAVTRWKYEQELSRRMAHEKEVFDDHS